MYEEHTGYSNSPKFSIYRLANNQSNFQNEISFEELAHQNPYNEGNQLPLELNQSIDIPITNKQQVNLGQ